ncbi:LuxR C-terminal-related transcriptional regulator [Nocardiopsis mangrovi]|uniref:LuxR C-terminal-related transcriptional regulator n=1 Tax=Nocardiopsis mangrovi TaxID=1179818 RepID=A0ABV9DXU3_9ACTN
MPNANAPIKVLLYDSHTMFRESLATVLRSADGLRVVGETSDPAEADQIVRERRPDVVVLDAADSAEILARLRGVVRAWGDARVLILTTLDDALLLKGVVAHGISGYLEKSVGTDDLVYAIKSIAGRRERMVMMVSSETHIKAVYSGRAAAEVISRRERDILILVAQGLSNAQIGQKLAISEGTVKRHLGNVFVKLGAASRIDAVNKAKAASLIPSPLG